VRGIRELYSILIADENTINSPTNQLEIYHQSLRNIANSERAAKDNQPTIWSAIWRAVCISFSSLSGVDNSQRLETFRTILQDVHLYLFLRHGRYLEWALRLVNLPLMSKYNLSQAQSDALKQQFKVLSFVVLGRMLLLLSYGTRVVLNHLDQQMASLSGQPQAEEQEDSSAASAIPVSNDRSSSVKKCWLCLDGLRNPSVLPCGHVFCWACLFDLRNSGSNVNGTNGITAGEMLCPMCRTAFRANKVRALHGY